MAPSFYFVNQYVIKPPLSSFATNGTIFSRFCTCKIGIGRTELSGAVMRKKGSKFNDVHLPEPSNSPQLELIFARKSGTVVALPKAHAGTPAKSSDSALKRLLDYAATLPGK